MYKYAVFISYKKKGPYESWISEIFHPIIRDYFMEKEGKDLSFLDIQEENENYGNSVNDFLNAGLIYSRCMIAVLNGPYFCQSTWCPKEFSVMKYRAEQTQRLLLMPVIFTKKDPASNTIIPLLRESCPTLSQVIENNHRPLLLERNRFLFTNKAFRDSAEYNVLVVKVIEWLEGSVIPAMVNAPQWSDQWKTPQWLLEPYDQFKPTIDCQNLHQQSTL